MLNIIPRFSYMIVCMNYKMLEYDRTDISEGIDICHYWYFLDKNFNYEPYFSSGCRDSMQKAMNFNDVAIVSIK